MSDAPENPVSPAPRPFVTRLTTGSLIAGLALSLQQVTLELNARAPAGDGSAVAQIETSTGQVKRKTARGYTWHRTAADESFYHREAIFTGSESYARLRLARRAHLELTPLTLIVFDRSTDLGFFVTQGQARFERDGASITVSADTLPEDQDEAAIGELAVLSGQGDQDSLDDGENVETDRDSAEDASAPPGAKASLAAYDGWRNYLAAALGRSSGAVPGTRSPANNIATHSDRDDSPGRDSDQSDSPRGSRGPAANGGGEGSVTPEPSPTASTLSELENSVNAARAYLPLAWYSTGTGISLKWTFVEPVREWVISRADATGQPTETLTTLPGGCSQSDGFCTAGIARSSLTNGDRFVVSGIQIKNGQKLLSQIAVYVAQTPSAPFGLQVYPTYVVRRGADPANPAAGSTVTGITFSLVVLWERRQTVERYRVLVRLADQLVISQIVSGAESRFVFSPNLPGNQPKAKLRVEVYAENGDTLKPLRSPAALFRRCMGDVNGDGAVTEDDVREYETWQAAIPKVATDVQSTYDNLQVGADARDLVYEGRAINVFDLLVAQKLTGQSCAD